MRECVLQLGDVFGDGLDRLDSSELRAEHGLELALERRSRPRDPRRVAGAQHRDRRRSGPRARGRSRRAWLRPNSPQLPLSVWRSRLSSLGDRAVGAAAIRATRRSVSSTNSAKPARSRVIRSISASRSRSAASARSRATLRGGVGDHDERIGRQSRRRTLACTRCGISRSPTISCFGSWSSESSIGITPSRTLAQHELEPCGRVRVDRLRSRPIASGRAGTRRAGASPSRSARRRACRRDRC